MAKKILIIDDEELIIKSLTRLLEKIGYEVFIAKNGEDAMVLSEEEAFDLIIADIRMPGMNGVETVKSIYDDKQKKQQNNAPVIFITGHADDDIEKAAKKLCPNDYIYKPFDIDNLLKKIKGAIG